MDAQYQLEQEIPLHMTRVICQSGHRVNTHVYLKESIAGVDRVLLWWKDEPFGIAPIWLNEEAIVEKEGKTYKRGRMVFGPPTALSPTEERALARVESKHARGGQYLKWDLQ